MFSRQCLRFLNFSQSHWKAVDKSNLAKLRKKTGYTFANCKKALEVNDNDLKLAEKWLKEHAQALGWSKAMKLEGRSTLQGLIGVAQKGNNAIMIEVNCETDFVARNKKFQTLVDISAQSCLNNILQENQSIKELSKWILDSNELKAIKAEDGKSLADHCALTISSLGENLNLRRAMFFKSGGNVNLCCFTHPSPSNPSALTLTGKYGALVAYTSSSQDTQIQNTARQICQHIVGMNPTVIGVMGVDEPIENKDDETVMINQEFLLDPNITVGQLITDLGIGVIDFVRFECGEQLAVEETSQLKATSHSI